MFTDFVMNGQGHGAVGSTLGEVRFDSGLLRPFMHKGRRVVLANTGRKKFNPKTRLFKPEQKLFLVDALMDRGVYSPVFNATSLRKEDWISIDRAVVRAARQRLRLWDDLMGSVAYGGFNGMAKITHEYEAMSDPGEAVKDMDGLSDGRGDAPLFKLRSVPLPITHSDFWFSERRLAVSRNTDTPLDMTMAEAAGRRVAEMIERTAIGVETGVTMGTVTSGPTAHDGTSTEYGLINYPNRVTKTDLNTPTGANPEVINDDVVEMIETMNSNGYFGPFVLYHSTGYTKFLKGDYFRTGGTTAVTSVRQRILQDNDLLDIRRLDYLTSGFQLVLIQLTSDVIQAINGMDITTVQWESQGGMRRNFKVMAIQVPLLKAPFNGVAAIVHGTTS